MADNDVKCSNNNHWGTLGKRFKFLSRETLEFNRNQTLKSCTI